MYISQSLKDSKNSLDVTLILMAAGDSVRFRKDFPIKKQWLRIHSKPLWLYVADNMAQMYPFSHIIITASKTDKLYMQKLCDYEIVEGGKTRQESLQNALDSVKSEFVLVNDVARWNITQEIVERIFAQMLESSCDCVAPRLGIYDTAIYEDSYINRESLFRIQTPQLSKTSTLQKALQTSQGTDESSIISNAGGKIAYVLGDEKLHKLTFKQDLDSLQSSFSHHCEIFIGNGIDVHSFEPNKPMMLGGVKIQSEFGFKAHSDGDVALHALMDSILGAMGAGDIGEWFPDTDSRFSNADSRILLQYIYDFARSVGFAIHNIDMTIMAQIPKISPYKKAMAKAISEILHIPLYAINIKATTTEKLGFIGRSEGVCVLCSTTLKLIDWKDL